MPFNLEYDKPVDYVSKPHPKTLKYAPKHITITQNVILEVMEDYPDTPLTCKQLAELTGKPVHSIRPAVNKLIRKAKLTQVTIPNPEVKTRHGNLCAVKEVYAYVIRRD